MQMWHAWATIPGIATRMAEQILSEIGTDVKKQFPTAALCVLGQD